MCDLVTMEVIKWNEFDGSYECEAIDACLSLSQDLVSEVKQTRCKLVEEVIRSVINDYCYLLSGDRLPCTAMKH